MASTTEEQKEDDRRKKQLIDFATSTSSDLYALLSLRYPSPLSSNNGTVSTPNSPTTEPHVNTPLTQSDIRNAWHKTALILHPDKNRGDEKAAADKLDMARKAYEVLKDDQARAVYDGRVRAKGEKEERERGYEGRRRRMKEELERRESTGVSGVFGSPGVKRKFEELNREEKREVELRRLAAEGARRRGKREEKLRMERLDLLREEALKRMQEEDNDGRNAAAPQGDHNVPEVDRTVKVRWTRSDPADEITKDSLVRLFSQFGNVENTLLLKDKKARPSLGLEASPSSGTKKAKKQVMGVAAIVFTSIVGAHAAVLDAPQKMTADAEWAGFESVSWASGQEPDFGFAKSTTGDSTPASTGRVTIIPGSRPGTPGSFPSAAAGNDTATTLTTPIQPAPKTNSSNNKIHHVPSFTFSPSLAPSTASPLPRSAAQSPSLFETTMMRLKEAEREAQRRKLEEVIRREEGEV